jgi:hypothetical protein
MNSSFSLVSIVRTVYLKTYPDQCGGALSLLRIPSQRRLKIADGTSPQRNSANKSFAAHSYFTTYCLE